MPRKKSRNKGRGNGAAPDALPEEAAIPQAPAGGGGNGLGEEVGPLVNLGGAGRGGGACVAQGAADPVHVGSAGPEPKKKGKKARRQGGGGDHWDIKEPVQPLLDPDQPVLDPDQPVLDPDQPVLNPFQPVLDQRAIELKCYEECEATVALMNESEAYLQECREIRISSEPSSEQLEMYGNDSISVFQEIGLFTIPVTIDGKVMHVPVTPAMPNDLEKASFHVVIMEREVDGSEVHFLIEQFSNYMKAVKIVLRGEIKEAKPWLILGLKNKLPSRFTLCKNVKYGESYGDVDKVFMHERRFAQMFEFYLTWNVEKPEDIEKTTDGEILVFNTFVCLCEFNRLAAVYKWSMDGVIRPWSSPLKLPLLYPKLLRGWSGLSKLVFALYIAILEAESQDIPPEEAEKSMIVAKRMWRKRQRVQKAISFCEGKGELELNRICGGQVLLLRHDYVSCDKILMRMVGYCGRFLKAIKKNPDGIDEGVEQNDDESDGD